MGGRVPGGKTLGPVAAKSPGLREVDCQKTGWFLPHAAVAQLWELLSNAPAGMSPWPLQQPSSKNWFSHPLQEQTWGHHWDHRSLLHTAHWDRGRHKEQAVMTSIAFLGFWDEGLSRALLWRAPGHLLPTWDGRKYPLREVQPSSLYLL